MLEFQANVRRQEKEVTGILTRKKKWNCLFWRWLDCLCGGGVQSLSCVWLFVTPCTIARRFLCPWNFPGKNTRMGCNCLLQRIFLTPGIKPRLLHCRCILYWLSHQGSPTVYVENPRFLSRTCDYIKASGYKVNIQKSTAFLYASHEHMEFEIKNITVASRKMKILRYK